MKKSKIVRAVGGLGMLAVLIAAPIGAGMADAISDFYKGKTIRLNIGTAVGGSYDIHGRTVGRHIWRHIPGKPRLIVQNKQGAGSQITAGYVYGVAPQDGTVMAALLNTLPMRQAIGRTQNTFDITKFHWIGNITNDVAVVIVWNSSTKVRTIDDLRKTTVITGATSATALAATIPKAMNYALGTKFKVVAGYKGGRGIDMALEKGEVAARAGGSWSVTQAKYPHWIKANKFTVLAQIGSHRAKGLENVPILSELARNKDQRLILEFFSAAMDVGKPIAVGPKVPKARVKALRAAFDAMVKDAAFLADAKKLGLAISPVKGAALQKLVAKIVNSPPHIIKAANKIFGKARKRKKRKK
ncbi:MAG: tripartite tricarboxylate transporter substrate-binding protein [Alphaproteobacteria bacterium]|nr:tripartite tricarboxylate transporter substrate-binding protein [Alphaproteobacteria bacterium]